MKHFPGGNTYPGIITGVLLIVLLFGAVTGFRGADGVQRAKEAQRMEGAKSSLRETWQAFSAALILEDSETLEALSTSCIRCSYCMTNTREEYRDIEQFKARHPDRWSGAVYRERSFIPISKFIREDIAVIMDSAARSAFLNDSLHFFVDDNNHNAKVYEEPCIVPLDPAAKYDFSEVVVSVPGKGHQGFSMAFAFIKTPEGYRFCGYSTIP